MDIKLRRESMKYKPYKKEADLSYTLGVFPTLELILNKKDYVREVILSRDGGENGGVKKLIGLCGKNDIPLNTDDKQIERLSPKENCYAIGIFNKYEQRLSENQNHIVLVNPSNTGNLGTIIRTMTGFGIKNLAIIKPGVDIMDPRVVRSSMGALFHISYQYFDTIRDYLDKCNNDIYTFMLKGAINLQDLELTGKPYSIVFGNESSGLTDDYLNYGSSIIIPHGREIDSLNLSIAVGIACYEFTKAEFNKSW